MFGEAMGGGGAGKGSLMVVGRVVARATTSTNFGEPISAGGSSSTTWSASPTSPTFASKSGQKLSSNNFTLSSGTNNNNSNNNPVSGNHGGSTSPCWPPLGGPPYGEDYEWVSSVDGSEDDRGIDFSDDFVLGPVPSADEVHSAVSALSQVFDSAPYPQRIWDKYSYEVDTDVPHRISSPVSLVGTELDWVEPSMHLYDPKVQQPLGSKKVYDAFHLLQHDPTVKKMVISLSSDKSVWDAVLNNEAVREVRESYQAVNAGSDESITPPTTETESSVIESETGNNSNPALNFVRWIFDNTKSKFIEVFEKVAKVVNELFKPSVDSEAAAESKDPFEEKLRASFMLSVLVLLVVVVTRGQRA